MSVSKEELAERFRLGREKAAKLREEGLLPPRRKRSTKAEMAASRAADAGDDDTAWMNDPMQQESAPAQRASIAETAEFKAAVARAVEQASASILERLAAKNGYGNGGNTADELSFARLLSAQIAELSGQTDRLGRPRIPTEILEQRRLARERLESLMIEVYTQNLDPEYEIMQACYLDEQLIDPTWVDSNHVLRRTTICWLGVPNEAMRPKNEVAQRVYTEFLASIGGVTAPINRPDLGRKSVKVLHREGLDDGPKVGTGEPKGILRITGRDAQPGQITETRVLGSIAAPARQLA